VAIRIFQRQTKPPTIGPTSSFDALELGGKVLALMAALLPAAGFLVRAIALSIPFGPEWGVPLAWSAPLPQLAATGLFSLLIALPAPLGLWLAWRLEYLRERTESPSRRTLRLLNVALILGLIVMVTSVLFSPGWPVILSSTPLGVLLVIGTQLSWRGRPRRRFRDIWWVVALAVLLTAVVGGFNGFVLTFQPARYEFDANVTQAVHDGMYLQLGEADGVTYLQRCGDNKSVFAVSDRAISSITYVQSGVPQAALGPSLMAVIRGATPRWELGLPPC